MSWEKSADELREQMIREGAPARDLAAAQAEGGQEWDTDGLQRDFDVVGFAAPFVVVVRKSDGVKGTLEFAHSPRRYFDFRKDS